MTIEHSADVDGNDDGEDEPHAESGVSGTDADAAAGHGSKHSAATDGAAIPTVSAAARTDTAADGCRSAGNHPTGGTEPQPGNGTAETILLIA